MLLFSKSHVPTESLYSLCKYMYMTYMPIVLAGTTCSIKIKCETYGGICCSHTVPGQPVAVYMYDKCQCHCYQCSIAQSDSATALLVRSKQVPLRTFTLAAHAASRCIHATVQHYTMGCGTSIALWWIARVIMLTQQLELRLPQHVPPPALN